MKHACMRRPWTVILINEFFPPAKSVSWRQAAFEWHDWCSRRIFIVWKMTEWFGFQVLPVRPGHGGLHKQWPRFHEHHNHWWQVLCVRVRFRNQIVPSFSWQWKSNKSLKHYLTQMLLAINWHYSQVGKNLLMYMKVQGCFIEIHQVFKKIYIRSGTFLREEYIHPLLIDKDLSVLKYSIIFHGDSSLLFLFLYYPYLWSLSFSETFPRQDWRELLLPVLFLHYNTMYW